MATFLLCKEEKLKLFLYFTKHFLILWLKKQENLVSYGHEIELQLMHMNFRKTLSQHSVETTEIFSQKFREIDGFIARFNSELLWRNFF